MLKTTRSIRSVANFKETKSKVDGNSIVGNNMVGGGETTNQANSIKRKNQAKTTKSKILVKSKNHDFFPNSKNRKVGMGFFTSKAKLAFIQLRQAFIETPIFHYFDPKSYIQIETNVSGYAISDVLSLLASKTRLNGVVTKTDVGQWHQIAFFSRKMIPIET